jgi:hypothetical protein
LVVAAVVGMIMDAVVVRVVVVKVVDQIVLVLLERQDKEILVVMEVLVLLHMLVAVVGVQVMLVVQAYHPLSVQVVQDCQPH